MAFNFNKVKEGLLNMGKDVEEFAKTTSNTAKIKYDIHSKESFVEKQFTLLGKAYFEAHKDEEVAEQEYFTSIKEAQAEIARLNEELLKAQGSVACPACGKVQEAKNTFCASCGAAMQTEEEKEAEVVAEVTAEEVTEAAAETVEEVTETVEEAAETVVLDEQ